MMSIGEHKIHYQILVFYENIESEIAFQRQLFDDTMQELITDRPQSPRDPVTKEGV